MRSSLAVRVRDGHTDRHVTTHTKGLKFKITAPGGHHSASMQIRVPTDTFPDLSPADKLWIYDTRTGETLWEGYIEGPGATRGPRGESYDITAIGGVLLASDQSQPLIYIDREAPPWVRYVGAAPSSQAAPGTNPADDTTEGLLAQFPPGQPIGTNAVAQIGYSVISAAGMEVGSVTVVTDSGKIDAGYSNELAYTDGTTPGAIQLPPVTGISTTAAAKATRWIGEPGHFPAGTIAVALRLIRTGGATNIADDNTWTHFSQVAVTGRRMDRHGVLLTGATELLSAEHVLAHWVAEDLLGRVLTMCDPDTAVIDPGTWEIDQLAYRDGVKAAQVLEDLAKWEPDMTWEILGTGPSGLHRFNFRAWPTAPRYEISTADGYELTGGEIDLCNRIAVNWTDAQGQAQVTVVTTLVPELDGTGRVRDAEPVTLPVGQGSAANAQRIGEQVLAAKADPPTAATATVARPILDHLTGTRVMPWEIQPGYLARVRETGEDLRITEMEFVDADCAATLTLGEPALTDEQRIARLSRVRAQNGTD